MYLQFLPEYANPSSEVLSMNYTYIEANGQLVFSDIRSTHLCIPHFLDGFNNTETTTYTSASGRKVYCFHGTLDIAENDRRCPVCGGKMHINGRNRGKKLRHINIGGAFSDLCFDHYQLACSCCSYSQMQTIPFKADNHLITKELHQYAWDLLAYGTYTLKQVSELTGLGQNTVKQIDKARLLAKYTIDGKELRQPEEYVDVLGIDEFKLHDGHKYATHIIDLRTGHILWISHGKKKQVVYDFIDHVGEDWMSHVQAVACDMNSDFEEAFVDRCPHIVPVFDHFHIVKNFNDKVISEVRKDEQNRLIQEGKKEAAAKLKGSKYILTSQHDTLLRKDAEAYTEKVVSKGNDLFQKQEYVRKDGYIARYEELLAENELLFTCELVKEKLQCAYQCTSDSAMRVEIDEIIDLCDATGNKHFQWFSRLLYNHYEGIIAHAYFGVSSGKIEGINNKIKTIRRNGYGYADDEYFFLKIMDASHSTYVRNPRSHRKSD